MCVDNVRGLIRAIECDWKIDSLDIMEDLRAGLLKICGKGAEMLELYAQQIPFAMTSSGSVKHYSRNYLI